MRVLFDTIRAAIYSAGFVVLWGYVALWVRGYDARLGVVLPQWSPYLGVAVSALGAALCLACIGTFVVRGRGTPAPFDAPRQMVAVGPYRWVRNPMYLGGALVMLGFGGYERSLSILLLAAVFLLAANFFVLLYEEPTLRARFNGSYEEYCRAVWRWIPRPPRRQAS